MPIPQPSPHESQADYHSRAMESLVGEGRDTDQANAIAFKTWDIAKGKTDKLRAKALRDFPKAKFEHVRDVPVFCEHDTVNAAGEPQHYDQDAMIAICEKMNHRIADTGSYAKISRGHTPDPEDVAHGAEQPDVLGFQGPYRVGMIGNKNPKYAIFADEFWLKQHAGERSKLPGRSVEIWQHPDMAERFFDPVAALGAETPRLDMPMKFKRPNNEFAPTEDGVEICKYSAAVFPGSGNTYVPSTDSIKTPKKKERYEMLSPEDLESIATLVAEKLQGCGEADAPGEDDQFALEEPTDATLGEEEGVGEGMGKKPYAEDELSDEYAAAELGVDDENEFKTAKMSRAVRVRYSKMQAEVVKLRKERDLEVAKLSRLEKDTAKRLQALEKDKQHAERYAKLNDLQSQGYVFRPQNRKAGDKVVSVPGLDREMERCSKMDEAQFADHLIVIAENYERQEVGSPRGMLYVPTDGTGGAGNSGTEARPEDREAMSKEARSRTEKYRAEGKKAKYQDVLMEVAKERGLKIA